MSAALTLVPTLYDRFDELAALVGTLEALEGEPGSPELRAAAEEELRIAISGTRDKIDRTAGVLASYEYIEKLAEAEIERITARKARIVKQRERLEGYVIGVLIAAGVQKFEGHTATLAVRPNPVSVVIEGEVDPDYLRTPAPKPVISVPDKVLIKAALSNGIAVRGARLAQTIRLVRS